MVSYASKIRRYAYKAIFVGVFCTDSIFHDGGMVMDENGINGRKWYLAQQFTDYVIHYRFQQTTCCIKLLQSLFQFNSKYVSYNNLQFINK